ncbi:LacI family DNA-binding transcriptional regulator [uncultured Sphaerochaeta sp.]|uniref:LacI family DNA-binding transcriptional regulator n=1 Tax=uncultured Sphaerochaeta sp. TaxID=886478 RepID=UPI002A0A342E|nr:LacI family DNA-binding transcriptional regulator [uncultured Sphaerochaeta sp.]
MKQTNTKEAYIAEISRRSGVSRSTIFRYFAEEPLRESSRNRIAQAIQSMDQEQELKAEALPACTTEIIVSVNSTTFDQFQGNSEALSGILEEAAKCGVRIRLERDFHGDRAGMGVIILGKHDPEETEERTLLSETGVPFVVVNRMIDEGNISYVASNVCLCASDMCRHLVAQGCRRVVFWGELETRVSQDKFKGYKLALQQEGIPYSPELVFPNTVSLEDTIQTILTMKPRPDAFMAMDDETAIKMIRLATQAGLRIPQDIAISGMNDLGSSKNMIPSLTSVKIPFKKLGKLALKTLLKNMEDLDYLCTRVTVRHTLVVRDSTKKIKE